MDLDNLPTQPIPWPVLKEQMMRPKAKLDKNDWTNEMLDECAKGVAKGADKATSDAIQAFMKGMRRWMMSYEFVGYVLGLYYWLLPPSGLN
jgi:hypothetical protein